MSININIVIMDNVRIVKALVDGELDISAAFELVSAARAKAKELDYNIIYDFRKVILKLSIADAYSIPHDHEELKDVPSRHTKVVGLLDKEQFNDNWQFYQNTLHNLGFYNWKFLFSEEDAIAWLTTD
jgi:hypothetical protein